MWHPVIAAEADLVAERSYIISIIGVYTRIMAVPESERGSSDMRI